MDIREDFFIPQMLLESSLVVKTVDLQQGSTSSGALSSVVSYSQSINLACNKKKKKKKKDVSADLQAFSKRNITEAHPFQSLAQHTQF